MKESLEPRAGKPDGPLDRLFEELVAALEASPDLDVEVFFQRHPAEAADLRRRLAKLRAVGFFPGLPWGNEKF